MDAHDFYIEWWTVGDTVSTPEPATFSMPMQSLKYFLKRLLNNASRRRNIVYLKDITTDRVILDRRNTC